MKQLVEVRSRLHVARVLSFAEDARSGSNQQEAAAFETQGPALPEADDKRVVHLVKLAQPLVARLAEVLLKYFVPLDERLAVEVVGVDLERHQPERPEARRLDDRHIVRRLHRRTR